MTGNADRYLDDLAVGEVWTGGPIAVSEEAIIAFAREYDPQPFHIDPRAAVDSPFSGLIASGWHVASLVMRQFVDAKPYGSVPLIGMGLDELRWLKPVRPGDVLTVRREIVDIRRSASKPDRGVVRTAVTVTNQDGTPVMRFTTIIQMPARPAA